MSVLILTLGACGLILSAMLFMSGWIAKKAARVNRGEVKRFREERDMWEVVEDTMVECKGTVLSVEKETTSPMYKNEHGEMFLVVTESKMPNGIDENTKYFYKVRFNYTEVSSMAMKIIDEWKDTRVDQDIPLWIQERIEDAKDDLEAGEPFTVTEITRIQVTAADYELFERQYEAVFSINPVGRGSKTSLDRKGKARCDEMD